MSVIFLLVIRCAAAGYAEGGGGGRAVLGNNVYNGGS